MTDPHAAAPYENPEDHLGPVIPDPWDDDDEQTDWQGKHPWQDERPLDVSTLQGFTVSDLGH